MSGLEADDAPALCKHPIAGMSFKASSTLDVRREILNLDGASIKEQPSGDPGPFGSARISNLGLAPTVVSRVLDSRFRSPFRVAEAHWLGFRPRSLQMPPGCRKCAR